MGRTASLPLRVSQSFIFWTSRLQASLLLTQSRRKHNMVYLIGLWESVRDFIATGGDVLYAVAAALFLMWVLMIERYWYLTSVFPKMKKQIIQDWNARADTKSWYAHRIREAWISEASDNLNARMLIIRTLVAMCPLIGLLGTVTGMISVFETMATQGTSNARLMAGGISMATKASHTTTFNPIFINFCSFC